VNVAPDTTFEAVIDTGTTGLGGTIGVTANDNLGATAIAFTSAGVVEIAPGVYAATLTAPADAGQYTLIWRQGASGVVLGIEDLVVTYSAVTPSPGPPPTMYATVEELQRLLRIDTPDELQAAAMERALEAAAEEIDWELGYTPDLPAPSPPPALVVSVNLDRAVEHWRQSYSPFGVIGVGAESEPIVTARDSWYRHARKLAPLKVSYGIA